MRHKRFSRKVGSIFAVIFLIAIAAALFFVIGNKAIDFKKAGILTKDAGIIDKFVDDMEN